MAAIPVLLALLVVAVGALAVALAALLADRRATRLGDRTTAGHWRALAGAVHDVQRTADHYLRAVEDRDDLRAPVHDYQAACRWLLLVVASGPTPPPLRPLVGVLTDARNPEAVAASRAGDEFLAGLAELQNAADDARTGPPAGRPPSEWRVFLRLACLTLRGRFRTT